MVARLRVLEHHTVPVVSLTADHGQTVAVIHVEVLQIKSISLFNRHHTLAVDNGDVQVLLEIAIDGTRRDLSGQPDRDILPEVAVV